MSVYRSVFSIGGSPSCQETTEKILPSGYAGGPTIFLRRRLRERKSREISPLEIISLTCPSMRFLEYPAKSSVQASDPEDTAPATFTVDYEF